MASAVLGLRGWQRPLPREQWVWVLAVAALFSVAQLPSAPGTFYPDSTQYLAQVYGLIGDTPAAGRAKVVDAYCDAYRRPRLIVRSGSSAAQSRAEQECLRTVHAQDDLAPGNRFGPGITRGTAITSPRYEAIFLSRPAVAAFYLPGVVLAGPRMGMWLTTLFWVLIGSVLVFLTLRVLDCRLGTALLGQVLFLVLPIRHYTMAPLAEGMTMTLLALCVLGAAYVTTGRTRLGLALFISGLAIGTFVKYSQFFVFAVALTLTALLGARRSGRNVQVIAVVSAAGAVLIFAGAKALGWPGAAESLQDLATAHFRRPDAADPVRHWLAANAHFWTGWADAQLKSPLKLVTWTVAAWGVLRSRCPADFVILAAALAGVANQIGHPDPSQFGRIIIAVWLLTIYGLPLLARALTDRRPAPEIFARAKLRLPRQQRSRPANISR